MRCWTLMLIVSLTATTFAEHPPEVERQWNDLVAELRSLRRVSSAGVGPVPQPGRFFKLAQRMIATGRKEDFQKLLTDEQPHVRCMGLLTLVQTAGKESVPALRAHLGDRGEIAYNPAGCSTFRATVADVARDLLHNANYLGFNRRPSRFFAKDELVGVDLQLVAKMPAITQSDRSTQYLTVTIEAYETIPDLSWLQKQCPDLASFEIVRVLGALRPTWAKQNFLIQCLSNEKLDVQSRLAAASALTRCGDEASVQALTGHHQTLNDFFNDQAWGDYLLETMKLKQQYETAMKSIRPRWPWKDVDPAKYRAAMASVGYHPLILDELLKKLDAFWVRPNPGLQCVCISAAIEVARHAADHDQPWDTYADTAGKLAVLIEHNRRMGTRGVLTEDECLAIERNIEASFQER